MTITSASILQPYYDKKGYDTLVCDDSNRLYAVFDGMGTSEGARRASQDCRVSFAESYGTYPDHIGLAYFIDRQTSKFMADKQFGGTTATVVSIDDLGTLHYAHVGDSRLYIAKDGRLKQITADEGYENILYNYVGSNGKGVSQLGSILSKDWDRAILCTDGVTGDREPDLLSDALVETILNAFSQASEEVCKALVDISTKKDDKSVVVIFKRPR